MNKYEILYILKNDIDDERKAALTEKFAELVKTLGGTVDGVDKWGTKKFAYPINFMNEGYYVLMNFSAAPTVPTELDRQMKIIDDVVRQMIIKK
ncbi:MAG: 30S ribosomal protein S6 [Clostridiaceae bacterium]|nr:30S ribosomal protein S6 [Clostridiaceae bacterium]